MIVLKKRISQLSIYSFDVQSPVQISSVNTELSVSSLSIRRNAFLLCVVHCIELQKNE